TSSNPAIAMAPSSISLTAGGTTAIFTVTTAHVSLATVVSIAAAVAGSTASATLTVLPEVTSFFVAPGSVAGGSSASGTITFTRPAPGGGLAILLGSDNTAVAVPATVVVPERSTGVTFPVTTRPVAAATAVTLSASYGGGVWTAPLSVLPAT